MKLEEVIDVIGFQDFRELDPRFQTWTLAALMDISERLQRLEARVFGNDCEHGVNNVGCRQCTLEGYRRVLAEQGKE